MNASLRSITTFCIAMLLAVPAGSVWAQGPALGKPRNRVAPQPRVQFGRAATYQPPLKLDCPSNNQLDDSMKPLGHLNTQISAGGQAFPPDCAAQYFTGEGSAETRMDISRGWPLTAVHWKPSGAVHRPLYFEDAPLERYGQKTRYIQPVISAARFYGAVVLLPYQMGYEPPRRCIYTLGYYRPGSCAPCLLQHPPASLRGAAYQVGAVASAILLIP